jgi:hypothetical protein
MRLAASLWLLVACTPAPPPVESCADDLSGIWAAADGRRYHLVERKGGKLEVYPLFDPVPDKLRRPFRTPAKTELERAGEALIGRSTFQAQGERVCLLSTPARLAGCRGNRAVLSLDLEPRLDMTSCAARPGDAPGVEIRRL